MIGWIKLILVLFAVVPAPVAAQDIDGSWISIQNTVEGRVEVYYDLKVTEDMLTGTVSTPYGLYPITNGEVSGNTFSFILRYGDINVYHNGFYLREQLLIRTSYEGQNGEITLNRAER